MKRVEASGRTLEEALHSAAQQLKVSVDAVEYEVVEEGARGFLGLGQTPTVIKAWAGEAAKAVAASRKLSGSVEEAAEEEAEEIAVQVEEAAAPEPEEPQEAQVSEEDAEAFVEAVMGTVGEILKPMRVDARPVLKATTDEEVVIDLVGPDVAILIGRRGQTLDALQYLVGIIASRRVHGRRRIVLDAEQYRERHQAMLEQKAREYAKAVKAEGKEAVLEPQPPRDRRIIHVALADDPDVYTYSEGEGDERHVVISPRK